MGILRNFINIEGINSEKELPQKPSGELVEYSEVDYIFVPEDKPEIKNIYEIVMSVESKNTRIINSPGEKLVVVDGIKKFKIMCSEKGETNKAVVLDIENPYNTFFELPKGIKSFDKINIYIADAYFQLIDGRKIYSSILYMIDIDLEGNEIANSTNQNENLQTHDIEFPEIEIYNEFL